MKRSEVQIWIDAGVDDCLALATRLEQAYGLDAAIVVPEPRDTSAEALAKAVGLALGRLLSEIIQDDMTIGVGWGRTMTASLSSFRPPRRQNCKEIGRPTVRTPL